MKTFEVTARLKGKYFNPYTTVCPYWMDEDYTASDIPYGLKAKMTIFARDEEEARRIVENYDFENDTNNPYVIVLEENPEIISTVVTETGDDEGEPELFWIEYKPAY